MHCWVHVLINHFCSSCIFRTLYWYLPQRMTAFGAPKTRLTLFAVSRWYAAAPDPLDVNGSADSEEEQERVIDNPRVHKLVDQICEMNILEIADLTELLRETAGYHGPAPRHVRHGWVPLWDNLCTIITALLPNPSGMPVFAVIMPQRASSVLSSAEEASSLHVMRHGNGCDMSVEGAVVACRGCPGSASSICPGSRGAQSRGEDGV